VSAEALPDREVVAEAVAKRVAELLRDGLSSRSSLLTVQDVAARLAASTDYVRDHADALGAIRLPGALLRFDPAVIDELSASARCPSGRPHAAESPTGPDVLSVRRRRRSGAAANLLPIKGQT